MRASSDTVVACVVITLGALCLVFSGLHRFHLGDSLLPSLVSLQAWTPFFWGQDRLGMLEPLLTLPIRSPIANLLVQVALFAAAGIGVAFVVARTVAAEPRRWMAAGALFVLALVAGLAEREQFRWFVLHHEYAVGLALAALGVLAAPVEASLRGAWRRWVAAAALFALAQWVNVSVGVPMGVLLASRALLRPRDGPHLRAAWTAGGLLMLTFGANLVAARSVEPSFQYGLLPLAAWPEAVQRLVGQALGDHGVALGGLASAAGLGLGAALATGRTAAMAPAVRAAAPLVLAGLVHLVFMACLDHVQAAGANSRYAFIALATVGAGLALFATDLVAAVWPAAAASGARVVVLAVVPALVIVHGAPSLGAPWAALQARWGAAARAVVDARCTHVAGAYDTVWPVVFVAAALRHAAGDPTPLWGIAPRAGPTVAAWHGQDPATWRVAMVQADPPGLAEAQWAEYGVAALGASETVGPLRVYRVAPSASLSASRGGSGTQ